MKNEKESKDYYDPLNEPGNLELAKIHGSAQKLYNEIKNKDDYKSKQSIF